MIKIVLLVTLLSTILLANELKTVYSYQNALRIAKEQNKVVLFMTSIDGCPVCAYIKNVVFEKEKIINYLNQHYIVVIKDAEKQSYPKRFHTRDMPTFYFINPDDESEIRTPKTGGSTPEKFLSVLRVAIEGENNDTIYNEPKKKKMMEIEKMMKTIQEKKIELKEKNHD